MSEETHVPVYKVVYDPVSEDGVGLGVSVFPGTEACSFEVRLGDRWWKSFDGLVMFLDTPALYEIPTKREGWTIIGELEYKDPKICEQTTLGYKGVWSPSLGMYLHYYGLGTPYGISDYHVLSRRNYIPILDAIKELIGLNDDDGFVDEWHGSALFRRGVTSSLCRFVGNKGWFDLL